MILTVIKFITQFIKMLESNQSPIAISVGFACGIVMGLPNFNMVYHLLFVFVFCLFNISVIAGFFGFSIGALLSFFMVYFADKIGFLFLSAEFLEPLWHFFSYTPILSLLNVNHSITCGYYILCLLLFFPFLFGFKQFIVFYRKGWKKKVEKHPLYKMIKLSKFGKWFFKVWKAAG